MKPSSASIPAVVLPVEASSRATGAYVVFLVFIVNVYSSISYLVPALAPLAPGKTLMALSVAALGWACLAGGRSFRLGLGAGGGALLIFFAIVALSPIWSEAQDASVEAAAESLKYLAGFLIAANVLDRPKRVRAALAAIALSSLFPAVGAIINFFNSTDLIDGSRAAWLGVFGNPNFLAYHLVMTVPLALALRDTATGRARLGWLALVGVCAIAILLTGSRGGTLGLGAVLVLWLVRSLARGRRWAIGVAAALVVAILMSPSNPLSRAETEATLSGKVDVSAQGRIDAWRTATRMVYQNPILGVGAGAFVPTFDAYAPGDAGSARAAHSSFLMVAAEVGLPALALFILAVGGAMVALGRIAKRAGHNKEAIVRGLQTSLFGFVVCSLTGGYAFTWPLYFVLGITAALQARERR